MLTLPRKHSKCYKAQPFPAPYEKITTVPKVFKKKIPKGYGLCCLTIMLAVSMYKLIWFSPSTDSEVVTALGWGCVHVTELRRGQVVCLVDGGTLRLLSQVPGLEDKRKRAIRGTIWKVTYFRSCPSGHEIGIYIRNEVGGGERIFWEWKRGMTDSSKSWALEADLIPPELKLSVFIGVCQHSESVSKIKYLCPLEMHIWVLQSGGGSYRRARSLIIFSLSPQCQAQGPE